MYSGLVKAGSSIINPSCVFFFFGTYFESERYFNPVVHGNEPMEAAAHGIGHGGSSQGAASGGGGGGGGSPPSAVKTQPSVQVSQQQPS